MRCCPEFNRKCLNCFSEVSFHPHQAKKVKSTAHRGADEMNPGKHSCSFLFPPQSRLSQRGREAAPRPARCVVCASGGAEVAHGDLWGAWLQTCLAVRAHEVCDVTLITFVTFLLSPRSPFRPRSFSHVLCCSSLSLHTGVLHLPPLHKFKFSLSLSLYSHRNNNALYLVEETSSLNIDYQNCMFVETCLFSSNLLDKWMHTRLFIT